MFQERFVLINETSSSQQAPLWWIPVSYTTASEQDFRSTRPKFWLEGVQSVVKDFPVKNEDWLIVNIQETGECYNYTMLKKGANRIVGVTG